MKTNRRNLAIEVEFFRPERPDEKNKGRIYIEDNGEDYIEFCSSSIGHFSPVNVFFAIVIDTGEKYSLVNCVLKKSNGRSCQYLINELYKGEHITNVKDVTCIKVEARMTGLTNWLNHPRIAANAPSSDSDESNIVIKKPFIKNFLISENIKLEIREYCRSKSARNETTLSNRSLVLFSCSHPESRMELHKNVLAFSSLLSIFTNQPVSLTNETFSFADGKSIEHISIRELKERGEYENEALLTYDKILLHWPNSLDIFYRSRDKFKRVIDLLTASIKNKTAEVSFLNITTAFEVFHKEFLEEENDHLRDDLIEELARANLIAGRPKGWTQIVRYWHLMKLIEHIDFFKQNFRTPQNTVKLLKNSRNYYTHYSQTKEEIWTPNRLFLENKMLRQLLKGIILLQLQIPANLINKLLNNRADLFYQDYENNQYSLRYLNADV